MNKKNMNQTETGRSMVEMLGVLAIIGVLSVGGIAGYTSAMNKHRANETVDRLMKRAMIVSSQRLLGQEGNLNGFVENDGAYSVSLSNANGANTTFQMTLADVPEAVCDKIKAMNWSIATITNDCTSFTFNNDLSAREVGDASSGSGEGNEEDDAVYCAGETCDYHELCYDPEIGGFSIKGSPCKTDQTEAACDGKGHCNICPAGSEALPWGDSSLETSVPGCYCVEGNFIWDGSECVYTGSYGGGGGGSGSSGGGSGSSGGGSSSSSG